MKDTTEMNRVIAEYMGYSSKKSKYSNDIFYLIDQYWVNIDNLKYHSSWDWLMPVWKKLSIDLKYKRNGWRNDRDVDYCNSITNFISSVDIEKAHQSIYNAIVYLNKAKEGKG